MPQDLFTVRKTAEKLNDLLVGAKVNKITEPNNDEILFTVYLGKVYTLEVCTFAELCRVGLSSVELENPLVCPNFCMLLRKHLQGAEITKIETPISDRIVAIHFKNKNELKDENAFILYAEIMGKYSNVFLVKDGIILGALKQTPQNLTSERITFTGAKYSYPSTQNKLDFMDKTAILNAFENYDFSQDLSKFIIKTFSGFAPVTADEIAYRINLLKEKNAEKITECILDFVNSKTNAVIIKNEVKTDFYAVDYYHVDGKREFGNDFLLLQSKFYSEKEKNKQFSNEKNSILSKINAYEKKELKKLELIQNNEDAYGNSSELQLFGELIIANLYKIKRGDEFLQTENYYKEDLPIVKIKLDPLLSPSKNAEKYYKKYAKIKKAYEYSQSQKEEVLNEIDYINSLKLSVETSKTVNDFKEIKEELLRVGIDKNNQSKIKKQVIKKASKNYAVYDVLGFKVKVGKNNIQNDALLNEANSKDIWLHVKNYHSSHVIIETENKEVPISVILTSAEICASKSNAKNGTKIEVDYTYKKFVKKQSGGKLGKVNYTDFKTLLVNPDKHENYLIKE